MDNNNQINNGKLPPEDQSPITSPDTNPPYIPPASPTGAPPPVVNQATYARQTTENMTTPSHIPGSVSSRPAGAGDYNWDYNKYEGFNKEVKEKKNRGLIVFLVILVISLILGLIALSFISLSGDTTLLPNDPSNSVNATTENGLASGNPIVIPDLPAYNPGDLLTTPQVAAKVTPSVVGILRYDRSLYEATGLGSGFIIKEENGTYYVATNNHVVESGNTFKIKVSDGRELDASVVGADPQSDLAVLKFEGEGFTVSELGDSDKLLVGETVVAIGNPLHVDLTGSVTRGIVSALNRTIDIGSILSYIQTDAAINPGNSGGALVNEYGQVIGINTAKVQGAGLEGLGFAIPINEAKPILEELMTSGKVSSRPVLGITGYAIDEYSAFTSGVPTGLMVKGVNEDTHFTPPLQVDDIITHVDSQRIITLTDLQTILASHQIDDTIELTVYRVTGNKVEDNLKISVVLIASE